MKKFIFSIFIFFVFSINALADSKCSYTEQAELLNKATNIKASYEIGTELVHFVDMDANAEFFNIIITNLNKEFYAIIKNDYNSESKTVNYTDAKDGVFNYRWNNMDKVTNFTIEIFASGRTNCAGEKFKTLYIQTPRYNEYYDREICEELTDFYLCQKYITSSLIAEDKFFEQIDSYKTGKVNNEGEEINNKNLFDKVYEFIKNNKWYVLGGIVLVSGTGIYISVKKSKKSRELGL